MPVLAVSEDPTVEESCVRSFYFVEESTDPDGFSVHPAKNNPNPTKPKTMCFFIFLLLLVFLKNLFYLSYNKLVNKAIEESF